MHLYISGCYYLNNDHDDDTFYHLTSVYRLVGLVVKASTSRAEARRSNPPLRRGDFSMSSHTSDLEIGIPVATLPGAWRCTVRPGIGVSVQSLGEVESCICVFYISVVTRRIVRADRSLGHTFSLLGR